MDLKTLKNFSTEGKYFNKEAMLVSESDLKANAIKRWKFAKEKENLTDEISNQMYWRGRMDELEENFNLEEGDLK